MYFYNTHANHTTQTAHFFIILLQHTTYEYAIKLHHIADGFGYDVKLQLSQCCSHVFLYFYARLRCTMRCVYHHNVSLLHSMCMHVYVPLLLNPNIY